MIRKIAVMCLAVALATIPTFGCVDTEGVSAPDKVQALAPQKSGADVLVPDEVIRTTGRSEGQAVYAACDMNGWFSSGPVSEAVKAATQMSKEGNWWRARGLAGQRFHPIILNSNGAPVWAKLEDVYNVNSDLWIDHSGGSPAILVR